MPKIRPLADRVVIEPLKAEEKTKSGIILPSSVNQERPEQGKVVSVGVGKMGKDGKLIPVSVKKGDVVIFSKYGPNEIKLDGKEYLIAREEDILAILE
ncbi:MAG: co-chaperone GroES [Candidatus Portnoybacteria bacterium CG10_big_fil_rev_8_21_14_0_10_36_7]|uniref:Co-chaperonin GroES n=1 Tax=Candidatus Portnoybacteria bacterium CG10_big_fil_rev_8_21_14_0_10_36_7 TaxID=1974812 RepID=A0A2M8KEQ8_9BACT|nr:MAG: co-chaperone GroES [Candidatus Portnoybacteria bacterium CG10_big_fil_rev_8_21_14_0_10_36_7]